MLPTHKRATSVSLTKNMNSWQNDDLFSTQKKQEKIICKKMPVNIVFLSLLNIHCRYHLSFVFADLLNCP